MKSILSLIAVSAVAFTAKADLTTLYQYVCAGETYASGTVYYQPWEFLYGFALGTQVDDTDTTSTCYGQVEETYKFLDNVATYAYDLITNTISLDFTDFSTNTQYLFQNINYLMIQQADQAIACQTGVFVKQFATRTAKLSGFMNTLFTAVYGSIFDPLIKPLISTYSWLSWIPTPSSDQKIYTGGSDIYTQFAAFFTSGTKFDCRTLGKDFGYIISQILEAKVESSVQFVEVQKYA